ncbi:RNA polymerase sigma factor [Rhodopseudomonas telluris]|uniref:RNA polymerase sigma factor n=1 Tax=Rhodopseudomonas telluris TaxID=644215 RepID=A0ABV6EWP1_9BRAD
MSSELANEFLGSIVALRPELLRQAAFLIGKQTEIGPPDDFVQDTLATALLHIDRFESGNLPGWLIAILRNHIRNARRRQRRSPMSGSPLKMADGGETEIIDFPVDATQELTLELEDIMAALRTLSAADQEVIWLARVEGLSPAEIAGRLCVHIGTVYTRLSRAMTNLRAAYDKPPAGTTMRLNVPRHHAA